MQSTYFDHPTEETLERFLLHQSQEAELEVLETHILACGSCVTRLEDLEVWLAATKLALNESLAQKSVKATAHERPSWRRSWFTVRNFSLAGTVAALALGIVIVPQMIRRAAPVSEVTLAAYRGMETSVVPEGHRLHVRLKTADLAEGPVTASIVNSTGTEIWNGTSVIRHEQVEISVPPVTEAGPHFLRLYAPSQGNSQRDLLREFMFQVE
jgi:hypothetical protein